MVIDGLLVGFGGTVEPEFDAGAGFGVSNPRASRR
jgi:hypothetical protein